MKKKALAWMLVLAMSLGLVACGKKETQESNSTVTSTVAPTKAPTAEPTKAPTETPAAGNTYTGTAKGFAGDVTMTLTIEDGKIVAATAAGPEETEGLGTVAVEKIAEAIVANQSVAVDVVSGATFSSNGAIEAAKAALVAAGLSVADYEVKAEKGQAEDVVKTADIVVVGAGGAGMTAAITAAKEGKSVIIVESQGMVGGNSIRATGGMNAADTEYQDLNTFAETAGVEKTLESAKAYADNAAITALAETVAAQWAEYQKNPTGYFDSVELFELDTMIGGKGINNPDLVKTLAANSAAGIKWLEEISAYLNNVGSFGGASVKRIHRPVNEEGKTVSVGSYLIPILEKACTDNGVEVVLNTKVTTILTDANGAAIGVVGTANDGSTVQVNAGAVILATGGFGANFDMVISYKPELEGFVTTNAPGILGEGITMAQAIGAATVDMEQIQIHPTVEQNTSGLITEGLRGDGAILVNAEGLRFCDEVGTRDVVSAAVIAQTGSAAWLIVDQKMVDASSVIAGYIKKGYTVQGDTYEALAAAMGVDGANLTATMEKWNACVAAGVDEEFGRTSFASPLDKGAFYAIKIAPGIHHTMGGLLIDTETHVLDTNGNAIAGLFAAGEITGGVHGANRLGGNAVADFVVFGRIAGESAAKYVK